MTRFKVHSDFYSDSAWSPDVCCGNKTVDSHSFAQIIQIQMTISSLLMLNLLVWTDFQADWYIQLYHKRRQHQYISTSVTSQFLFKSWVEKMKKSFCYTDLHSYFQHFCNLCSGHISLQHLLRMMMADETLLRTPGEISWVSMMRKTCPMTAI